jgi:hypothetical protein
LINKPLATEVAQVLEQILLCVEKGKTSLDQINIRQAPSIRVNKVEKHRQEQQKEEK